MKKLLMVKFGGAVLTDKAKPCTVRWKVIDQIAGQLSECIEDLDAAVLLGNGGGSFGHYYAEEYYVTDGVLSQEALLGMCRGKNGNSYLNMELVKKLIKYGIPACTYKIEQMLRTDDLDRQLLSYLENKMLPVVYGDFLYEGNGKCRVISTEEIFLHLGQMIIKEPDCGFMLEKIIFCTDRDGVEDLRGQVIPIIDRRTFHNWEIFQREAEGYDVTGGMLGKVRMAFEMRCPVQIINGNDANRLKDALRGAEVLGTLIYG